MLSNNDVRLYAKGKDVRLYEIAKVLGVCDMTLSRKLRYELSEPDKEQLRGIIDKIATQRAV